MMNHINAIRPEPPNSLLWWVDNFTVKSGHYYRYRVEGTMQDCAYPDADYNGRDFLWSIPNLRGTGGIYAFRLAVVTQKA